MMINGYFNHQTCFGDRSGVQVWLWNRYYLVQQVNDWIYGRYVELLNRVSQITYNWGAPHCIIVTFVIIKSKTWIYFGKGWQG
jgi:hypothetical protein